MGLIYLLTHLNCMYTCIGYNSKAKATSENSEIFYSVINFAHCHTLYSFFSTSPRSTLRIVTHFSYLNAHQRHQFVLLNEPTSQLQRPNSQSPNGEIKLTMVQGCRTGPSRDIGLWASKTTQCHSRLYPPVRDCEFDYINI